MPIEMKYNRSTETFDKSIHQNHLSDSGIKVEENIADIIANMIHSSFHIEVGTLESHNITLDIEKDNGALLSRHIIDTHFLETKDKYGRSVPANLKTAPKDIAERLYILYVNENLDTKLTELGL